MRCSYVANKKRWQPNSCNSKDCPRKSLPPESGCCYVATEESIKKRGTGAGYLRKCLTCGLEAKTTDELSLFKKRKGYPYDVDAICIKCHTAKNVVHERIQRKIDPTKSREAVMKNYRKDPSKQRARDYSWRHIETGPSCADCGVSDVPLEKHHPDYSRPDFIITLCRSCHHRLHIAPPKPKPKLALCDKCTNQHFQGRQKLTFHCKAYDRDVCRKRKRYFKCSKFLPIILIQNGVH